MGRELRRVPLDFDWPLNKPYEGFINPLYCASGCSACGGTGYSDHARHLTNLWYGYVPFQPADFGSVPFLPTDEPIRRRALYNVKSAPHLYGTSEGAIVREATRLCRLFNGQWSHHLNERDVAALVAADRLWDLTRDHGPKGWGERHGRVPTPREVNLWSISGFGHDSINKSVVVRARCEREGQPELCAQCAGAGEFWPSEEAKAAYDAWEPTDPPTGPGYQIWETVSEGSPISPVFETPAALAAHMATTKWGADKGRSAETWLAFIEGPGWAPSMVASRAAGIQSGVDAVVDAGRK